MLGVITAVGGGMVRDIMLLKVPTIFGGNTLYATSALVASIEMVVLSLLGYQAIGSAVAILSGALLSSLPAVTAGCCPPGWNCASRSPGCC